MPDKCPYRPDLPERPSRVEALPIDSSGYPVPWFTPFINGKPDLRFSDPQKFVVATNTRSCWICGQKLGAVATFVLGPLSAFGGVSSEPPSHPACAEYSAKACPFLTRPKAGRRSAESGLPSFTVGNFHPENPGICALWATRTWRSHRTGGGYLIVIGPPESIQWWTEGRTATRSEVEEALVVAAAKYHENDPSKAVDPVRVALLAASTFAEVPNA